MPTQNKPISTQRYAKSETRKGRVPDWKKVSSSKGRAAKSAKKPSERTAKKSGTSHPNNPPPTIMPPTMEFRKELNSPRSVVSASIKAQRRAMPNSTFPKNGERGKRCAKFLNGSGAKSATRCLIMMARPRSRAMMGSMEKQVTGCRLQVTGYRLQVTGKNYKCEHCFTTVELFKAMLL